ncbi:endonuclease/exonuclease/phosphatase family protein [Dongshaea marina]|uniref:endonuclease/exonuclease/phosphatase family protein n=1 Tax=Dongshaea marina TaxID=2047966 RepID=UPI000D3E318A|nr:endonuclease/exonuclease/phosphatase family protein [Dongshaea marina]
MLTMNAKLKIRGRWLWSLVMIGGLSGCLEIDKQPHQQQGEPLGRVKQIVSSCSSALSHSPAHPDEAILPGRFSIVVWNIYKQKAPLWQQELERFAHHADILLLQEAVNKPGLLEWLRKHHYHWELAEAFRYRRHSAGVLSAARIPSLYSCHQKAPEPFLRIPKTAMVTRYPLEEGTHSLLVVNIHSVNFDLSVSAYREQLQKLTRLIRHHEGPVILAGDLNSWSEKRQLLLEHEAAQLKLKPARIAPDQRMRVMGRPLDHLYYRGLSLVSATAVATEGSDHHPILASFKWPAVSHSG